MAQPSFGGIKLVEIRIENFRSLKRVNLSLDHLTVLIGENNSGKTGLLEAVSTAIGVGRRGQLGDDIFVDTKEGQAPKDRVALIDLLILPADEGGKTIQNFPEGSPWLALWGMGIAQDSDKDDADFLGLRAIIRWSATKGEYEITRRFLTTWPEDPNKAAEAKVNEKAVVTIGQIEPLAFYLLDAKRDIQDELQNRASFWNKLTADLGLSEKKVGELEETLSDLNSEIVESSSVLKHVQSHLDTLYKTLSCEKESISITPLSRHLRDFKKGLDISFQTDGASSFPLARHGMGTRSLATVLAFRAYTSWRHKNGGKQAVHSMLGLEEPESHLHPQAQRALFHQLQEIPGQKIVSTHSPYIVSQAEISSIRHFKKRGAETEIRQLNVSGLEAADLKKLSRFVLNSRGDILYARAVVIFEGETEEHALPIFAAAYFVNHPHSLGLSFAGVGGHNNYLPFLRLVVGFDMTWGLLGDGEPNAVKAMGEALKGVGINDASKASQVALLPPGQNFESYLLDQGYEAEIEKGIVAASGVSSFVDEYISLHHGLPGPKKTIRDYNSAGGRKRALLDIFSSGKTAYATSIANAIVEAGGNRKVPKAVAHIFERFAKEFGWEVRK